MSANQYTVLDPDKDPSIVSVPPPQRKPSRAAFVKKSTTAEAVKTIATVPVGVGAVSPAAGDQHLATADEYSDPRMDVASRSASVDVLTNVRGPANESPPNPPKCIRIQFETAAGVYSVPALSVTPSRYGLMVMLPRDDSQASFVPAIGSTFTVGSGRDSWVCYFPGTEFDLDAPPAKVLVFVFAERK